MGVSRIDAAVAWVSLPALNNPTLLRRSGNQGCRVSLIRNPAPRAGMRSHDMWKPHTLATGFDQRLRQGVGAELPIPIRHRHPFSRRLLTTASLAWQFAPVNGARFPTHGSVKVARRCAGLKLASRVKRQCRHCAPAMNARQSQIIRRPASATLQPIFKIAGERPVNSSPMPFFAWAAQMSGRDRRGRRRRAPDPARRDWRGYAARTRPSGWQ